VATERGRAAAFDGSQHFPMARRRQRRLRSMKPGPAARTRSATSRGGRSIYFFEQRRSLAGAGDNDSVSSGLAVSPRCFCDSGFFQITMTQENLNRPQIRACLDQVCGEAVALPGLCRVLKCGQPIAGIPAASMRHSLRHPVGTLEEC